MSPASQHVQRQTPTSQLDYAQRFLGTRVAVGGVVAVAAVVAAAVKRSRFILLANQRQSTRERNDDDDNGRTHKIRGVQQGQHLAHVLHVVARGPRVRGVAAAELGQPHRQVVVPLVQLA